MNLKFQKRPKSMMSMKLKICFRLRGGVNYNEVYLDENANNLTNSTYLGAEVEQAIINELDNQIEALKGEFEETVENNGWISKIWDKIKNFTKIGAGSDKTREKINEAEKYLNEVKEGKINLNDAYLKITGKELSNEELSKLSTGETSVFKDSPLAESIDKYTNGQKMCVDIVGDIFSGIASVGVVALGSVAGICAAPFTAGASLGLVAAGLGMAAATGAVVKTGIKASDCVGNDKKYELKDFGYDVLTGSINGLMGPVSNGLGGATSTAVAKTLGMEALETTAKSAIKTVGKEIVEEGVEAVVKNSGKTLLKRGLVSASGMVVDGSLSGATDGFARALAEGRIEDIPKDMIVGAVGGAVASPIIGGGMSLIGKGAGKLGSTIFDGIQQGKNSLKNPIQKQGGDLLSLFAFNESRIGEFVQYMDDQQADFLGKKLGDLCEKYGNNSNNDEIMQKVISLFSMKDANELFTFLDTSPSIRDIANKIGDNEKFIQLIDVLEPEYIQQAIETIGTGPTKITQILSNNEAFMKKLDKYPNLQIAIKNTKSNCSFSRTITEAEEYLKKCFPDLEYTELKSLSAASIGETYLLTKSDGSQCVVKMLKNGVTEETLNSEKEILKNLIYSFSNDEGTDDLLKQIDQLYSDWASELDFSQEYAANKRLATQAKRYKVADITDISSDQKCIIMNKANGIQMDKLKIMLDDYKLNPDAYNKVIQAYQQDPQAFVAAIKSFEDNMTLPEGFSGIKESLANNEQLLKFAKALPNNEWLVDPEKVIETLPKTFMKAFDEQLLFTKGDGATVMHGDAHTGNFFVTTDEAGELIPEFIDTGLTVSRTADDVANDVMFFTSYFTGNSNGVAEYFIDSCTNISPENRANLVQELTKYLDEEIFSSNKNITEVSKVIAGIQDKLAQMGVSINPETITAMKAQSQFLSVAQELASLSGSTLDIPTVIKDVPKAVYLLVKNGTNPFKIVKNIIKGIIDNPKQAVASGTQFIIKQENKKQILNEIIEK